MPMSDSLQQPNSGTDSGANPNINPATESASSDDMRALAAAYAFGATDQSDTEQLREAMAQDANIGDEVQTYRRLFTVMHYTTPPVAPPEALEIKLREATSPSASPIAQPYSGPGSEAARREMENEARPPYAPMQTPASAPSAPTGQEGERIGYWPSTPAPTAPARPASKTNPFLASGEKVNPLTGRPMPPVATTTPNPVPATGSTYPRQSTQRVPTQQAGGRQPAQRGVQQTAVAPPPAYAAIPEAFRTMSVAQAARKDQRQRARIGWSAALVTLLLLLGSNYFWFTSWQQSAAQQQQFETQIAQVQGELATSQQTVTTLQQQVDEANQGLAANQTTIDALRAELDETLESLAAAEESLVAATPQQVTGMGMSDNVLSALAQGTLEDAMLQPMNATDAMTATARIVWNPEMQSGMMIAMNMPTLAEGRTYQLWLVSGGVPTSAGMFTVDERGMGMLELTDMPIGDYEVAAITAEPMTGSLVPTSTILIAGEL